MYRTVKDNNEHIFAYVIKTGSLRSHLTAGSKCFPPRTCLHSLFQNHWRHWHRPPAFQVLRSPMRMSNSDTCHLSVYWRSVTQWPGKPVDRYTKGRGRNCICLGPFDYQWYIMHQHLFSISSTDHSTYKASISSIDHSHVHAWRLCLVSPAILNRGDVAMLQIMEPRTSSSLRPDRLSRAEKYPDIFHR